MNHNSAFLSHTNLKTFTYLIILTSLRSKAVASTGDIVLPMISSVILILNLFSIVSS